MAIGSYPAAKELVDMMTAANVDPSIISAFEEFAGNRSYGYVFEHNRPEPARLWRKRVVPGDVVNVMPPRDGKSLSKRRKEASYVKWRVEKISNGVASLSRNTVDRKGNPKTECKDVHVSDVVAVAEFDQPIYPGLKEVGSVLRGGDKPAHMVINGENYHALQQLQFAYAGKVDCIYIDMPYNTGSKDWQYADDYISGDDAYRHSKWSAFVERRLKRAMALLADDGCIFMSIDDHEMAQLKLMCDDLFGENNYIGMMVWRKQGGGKADSNFIARNGEYVLAYRKTSKLEGFNSIVKDGAHYNKVDEHGCKYRYETLDRQSLSYQSSLDYPLEIDGEVFYPGGSKDGWERRHRGEHGSKDWCWRVSKTELAKRMADGRIDVVIGRDGRKLVKERCYVSKDGVFGRFDFLIDGYTNRIAHNQLMDMFDGNRVFEYPKPVDLIMDLVGLVPKKDALVLDFFAGSGTTLQAVAALNACDGGTRRCILVTNNEVSEKTAKSLRKRGLRPGDDEWEAEGVARKVCFPRIVSAVNGVSVSGKPLKCKYGHKTIGKYGAVKGSDGLDENVRFFDLTYEDPYRMRQGRLFERVAPMLWAKAECRGDIIARQDGPFSMTDDYGVLFSYSEVNEFIAAARARGVHHVFVVSDEECDVDYVVDKLPGVVVTQLYKGYLRTFEIHSEGMVE